MATKPDTVAFFEEQLAGLPIRIAPMFGEYGVWFDDKPIGVICRDTLYLKRSDADPALLDGTRLEPAYPGAKPSHAVPPAFATDGERLTAAVRATAAALPEPKRRKKPSA